MHVHCLKQSSLHLEFAKELLGLYKLPKNVFTFLRLIEKNKTKQKTKRTTTRLILFVVTCMSYLYLRKWYIRLHIELIVDRKSPESIKIFFHGSFCMTTNFVSECVHYSDASHDREQKILNGSLYTISKVCFSEMEINTSI